MPPTIRRATLDDADALSRIGAETFTETFGHMYPPQDLAAFLPEAYGPERTRRDLADPAKASWLVEADGVVVGYATAGPCDLPHAEVTSACGELKRLYVLKAHQGGGTGSRLLAETLGWLEKDGPRPLWIGVWSENYGAQRLYGRMGFEKVGEYDFVVGETRDHEFILRRR
ncbi:GNAT family N-acetyltransferase [Caulobacter mirabilis]|uniref:GNAT family N-acetyltransferase n=1 Tax=Caulobacter mirabilis TaxID=69666 RepID=A0A2D2B0D4_9CAUL|nr:GNAT family N-acetyltransferase [Caulobacter mirabilis]ATQ43720.1 GNAT family N-acetyltransferase [Caulobacter mirabilis]